MEILKFFIASLPILWLIFSLGVLSLPAYKTCSFTLIATILIAVFGWWQMPMVDALAAASEGAALALWPIMIVILSAVFTYNLSLHTKSMDIIKSILSSISSDRRILVLIIAWGFGGFLESVAGYGTAVAIPASILAAMGFDPLFAAVICLIANTVPTAFGAIGIPISTMANVTGLSVLGISYYTALQLFIFIILITFLLVMICEKSIKGVKGVFLTTLVSGLSFAIPQLLVAKYMGPELPSVIGSICSMGATIAMAKIFHSEHSVKTDEAILPKEKLLAWLPYILIFVFMILCSNIFPGIKHSLAQIKTSVIFYGDKPYVFKWIATPGSIILIAAFIGGKIQGAEFSTMISLLLKTAKQLTLSAITVVSIVAMAKVMAYSGMINSIAVIIATTTGSFYPIIAPMIGALGTFVTGSDTSSNVLFGKLQLEIAHQINCNPLWLVSASAAGATAGKMISPQSIAVATAATGLIGSEGKILSKTIIICLGYVLILGILVYIGGMFIPA